MSEIITSPRYNIIEQIAVNIAAIWYEIGRSQGLTSKYKNAKEYAKANIEKFIPNAVSIALEMLGPHSNLPEQAKMEIYSALMERHNDPTLVKYMPNIDVNKVLHFAEMVQRKKPIEIAVDKALQSLKADVKVTQSDFENSLEQKDIPNGEEVKTASDNAKPRRDRNSL